MTDRSSASARRHRTTEPHRAVCGGRRPARRTLAIHESESHECPRRRSRSANRYRRCGFAMQARRSRLETNFDAAHEAYTKAIVLDTEAAGAALLFIEAVSLASWGAGHSRRAIADIDTVRIDPALKVVATGRSENLAGRKGLHHHFRAGAAPPAGKQRPIAAILSQARPGRLASRTCQCDLVSISRPSHS